MSSLKFKWFQHLTETLVLDPHRGSHRSETPPPVPVKRTRYLLCVHSNIVCVLTCTYVLHVDYSLTLLLQH